MIEQKTFNELWKHLALERFLSRLAISSLDDILIFKGGFLLAYLIEIGRETTDFDFLARNTGTQYEEISSIMQTNKIEMVIDEINVALRHNSLSAA